MGRASKADVRRPEILRHFIDVINAEGLDNASIAKTAKAMGVFPNHIQHYFGSRENLILALIDYMLEEYQAMYEAHISGIDDPVKKDDAVLDLVFSREWAGLNGPLLYLDLFSKGLRSESVRKSIVQLNQLLRQFLKSDLSAFREGRLSDESAMLDHFVFILEGFHMWSISMTEEEHAVLAEEQKSLMKALLAHG